MSVLEQRLKEPLGKLEGLAESTREFQNVVQAFYDTLDTAHSRIRIIRVSPHTLSVSCETGLHQGQPSRTCSAGRLETNVGTGEHQGLREAPYWGLCEMLYTPQFPYLDYRVVMPL